ncbi:MAG: hypothetical protein ACREKH_11320, partial [Candidatus Rokuibacteriota bacterium]
MNLWLWVATVLLGGMVGMAIVSGCLSSGDSFRWSAEVAALSEDAEHAARAYPREAERYMRISSDLEALSIAVEAVESGEATGASSAMVMLTAALIELDGI